MFFLKLLASSNMYLSLETIGLTSWLEVGIQINYVNHSNAEATSTHHEKKETQICLVPYAFSTQIIEYSLFIFPYHFILHI